VGWGELHRNGRRSWRRGAQALVLGLLLCLHAALAAAAPPGPPPLRDYQIDGWTTRNGLLHNSVRDIAQTAEGYLWFTTWEGVVRYNGAEFTPYHRGTGLRDNGVGSLYLDPRQRLWLADSRGNLGRLGEDGGWHYLERHRQWPRALIHDLAMDGQGRLWLLFEGHGLGSVAPDGSLDYIPPPPGIPLAASFQRMAVDRVGNLWIGTLEGLVQRSVGGQWRRYGADDGLPGGLVWPYLAPDGVLWLAAGERLFRRAEDGRFVQARVLPGAGYFTSMLQDREGNLWLGTENRGLARISAHGVEWLPPERLGNGRIGSLLEDAEGGIWIGANGGLFRLREALFTGWTRVDGLGGDYVRALLEDAGGTLWVGGGGGLDRMGADGRFHPVPLQGGEARVPSILSLAEGPGGELWVGTFADGVFHLRHGHQLARYAQAEGVPSGHVRAIAVDAQGQVWVGSRRGVVRIDAGGVHPAPALAGMPQGLITALAAFDDALWIGSVDGASVLRGDRVQHLPLAGAGGDPRTVFGFHKVGGAVWISSDRGLYRLRDGRLGRVGREQGLPVDAVFSMLVDDAGDAWLTSNRGVIRVPLAALDAAADGGTDPLPLQHYTEIDGMPSSQGNGSSSPAAIRRRDGSIWVATAAGAASVDPERLARYAHRPPPPAVVETVAVDGQALDWRSARRLPGGSRLAVTYAGLSYLLPERIRYRTRLAGLDPDWIERGTRRDVEFIGLPPGRYTLEVQAAHPGGAWSERPARWSFEVEPLWWQRTGVQVAGALAVLLLLYAAYAYRVHRYQASNRRLAQLVDARTADLQAQAQRLLEIDRERAALVEQLRRQAEAYSRQAREDALTGLPNRRRFEETLDRDLALARRGAHPLCLALLDIDHFKRINDSYSHSVGDQVLREVGQLLESQCRGSDLVARLGGEEFALLMPHTRLEEARVACQRLQQRFRAHRPWAGREELQVTVSVGLVALRPDEGREALYRRADEALYQAKHAGRDRLHVDA